MRATFMLGASLGLALLGGWGRGQGLFDVEKRAPERVVVLWQADKPAEPLPTPGPAAPAPPSDATPPAITADLPPMARVLAGGFELTKSQIAALRRSPGPEAKKVNGEYELAAGPIAILELSFPHTNGARVELFRGLRGEYLGRREGESKLRVLKPDVIGALGELGEWSSYAGAWDKAPAPFAPGVACDVPRGMLRPAWLRLDLTAILDRGLRGRQFRVDPAACELGDATVRLRPPKGYDPRKPVGLLVWIDPSPNGAPPDVLSPACDELGLAVVGVSKSGNECGTGDRTQRALDALATAEAILHIDRSRVYVTGLSGGGRMSSILAGCFPDVFAGAVSMAGVAHYEDKVNELGKLWPAYFLPPTAKRMELYKTHRLAATTGPKDFNHEQTLVLMDMQKEAGLQARVFVFDEIGHQTPDSDGFAEALRWVDEPQREAAKARALEGEKLLADAEKLNDEARRKALLKVMEKAPWSDAAWKAAASAGLTR